MITMLMDTEYKVKVGRHMLGRHIYWWTHVWLRYTDLIIKGSSWSWLHGSCEIEPCSGEVYSIQHYVIKFVSYRIVGYFRRSKNSRFWGAKVWYKFSLFFFRGLNKTVYFILADGYCMSKKVQEIMVHFVISYHK